MIISDKQRYVSEQTLQRLSQTLSNVREQKRDDVWLQKAELDAIQSEIAKIESDVREYDMLKSGEISFSKSFSLDNLPETLVRARIASGLSQSELASKLGLKPQQIQRYETTDYQGMSLSRLIRVCEVLDVHTEGIFETDRTTVSGVFSWEKLDDFQWSQFPINEMVKRGWIKPGQRVDLIESVKAFMFDGGGSGIAMAMHRKKIRSQDSPNAYALLAWQIRVLQQARDTLRTHVIPEFDQSERWIPDLVYLTRRDSGPREALELLAEHGILVEIVTHLSGTNLDGAAMLSQYDRPVNRSYVAVRSIR